MKWHRLFFTLLLVFLPTQLGFHFWPAWAMVLGRRVDYLSPTLYVTDVIIVFILLFWLIEHIRGFKIYDLRFKNKKIILLGICIGINIYFAANQPVAIFNWIKVLEFGLLGWYIVKTKPNYSLITSCLSVGVLYSSLIAIAQFMLQRSVGGPLWWLGERTFTIDTPGIARIVFGGREYLRSYATFPHPNVLGGFLAVTLPLFVSSLIRYFVKKKNKQEKLFLIWYLSVLIIGSIALVLTFSRSALIVGAIAIMFTLARSTNKKILASLLFLIIIFGITLFSITPQEESVVVREQLNTAAIKLWQQSPFIGVGLGNFLVKLPAYLPSRTIYFLQPVHNVYLLVLAETGAVGLVLTLWFVWLCIKSKTSNTSKTSQKFSPVLLVPLLTLLLLGLVDHYPLTLQQGQLLITLFVSLSLVHQKAHR